MMFNSLDQVKCSTNFFFSNDAEGEALSQNTRLQTMVKYMPRFFFLRKILLSDTLDKIHEFERNRMHFFTVILTMTLTLTVRISCSTCF